MTTSAVRSLAGSGVLHANRTGRAFTMRRLAGLVISTFGAACQLGVWHDPHQPILRLEAATPFPVQRTMGLQLVVDGQVSNVLLLREGKQLATLTPPAYSYVWDSGNEAEGSYRLKATARTASGETVASNEVTVVIDRTGPDVVSYAPAPGNDPVLLPFTVTFSEPLLRASVTPASVVVLRNDVQVESDVSLSENGLSLTVTPRPPVRGAYRIVLFDDMTDLAGNPLRVAAAAASWQRVVVPPGPVTSLDIQAFTDTVRVLWSAPLDNGGSPITGYNVRPTGIRWLGDFFLDLNQRPAEWPLGAASNWVPSGQAVTYTISAVSAVGEGPASAASIVMPSYEGTLIFGGSVVTLDSGKVLITGDGYQAAHDRCEFGCPHQLVISLYDPDSGSLVPAAGSASLAMSGATAARLADGRVLVAMGFLGGANIYDPVKDSFTRVPTLQGAFSGIATPLKDGRVLFGSVQGLLTADANGPRGTVPLQIYEPASNAFVEVATSPPEASAARLFALLPSGEVLLAGDRGIGTTAVLFNPGPAGAGQFSFKSVGPMLDSHNAGTATALPDGRVLVAGGLTSSSPPGKSCEIYDPAQGTFSRAPDLLAPRQSHTATLLGDGRVLFAGGTPDGANSVEIYDPATGGVAAPDLKCSRVLHTANRIAGNRLLLIGGNHLGSVGGTCPEEIYPLP